MTRVNEGTTHWDGCWREHLDCAVARVEQQAIAWAEVVEQARIERDEARRAVKLLLPLVGKLASAARSGELIDDCEAEIADALAATSGICDATDSIPDPDVCDAKASAEQV